MDIAKFYLYIVVSLLMIIYHLGSPIVHAGQADLINSLQTTLNNFNKTLPKMVNGQTRVDSTLIGPGLRLTFFYTFIKYNSTEFDSSKLFAEKAPILRKGMCSDPYWKRILEGGFTIDYYYRGKDWCYVMEIPVKESDCK